MLPTKHPRITKAALLKQGRIRPAQAATVQNLIKLIAAESYKHKPILAPHRDLFPPSASKQLRYDGEINLSPLITDHGRIESRVRLGTDERDYSAWHPSFRPSAEGRYFSRFYAASSFLTFNFPFYSGDWAVRRSIADCSIDFHGAFCGSWMQYLALYPERYPQLVSLLSWTLASISTLPSAMVGKSPPGIASKNPEHWGLPAHLLDRVGRRDFLDMSRMMDQAKRLMRKMPEEFFDEKRFFPLTNCAIGFDRNAANGTPRVFSVVSLHGDNGQRFQVRIGTPSSLYFREVDYTWGEFVAAHQNLVPCVYTAFHYLLGFMQGHLKEQVD